MRSLIIASFLAAFLLGNQAWSQTKINLFVIEKPIENYQNSQLNNRLQSAMRDLLVRVVGGEEILQTAQAEQYIGSARSWVKNYSFENREADGVVVGQKLVVEFDRERLLKKFQADGITIWPLANRPKTLLLGHWSQQGLSAIFSAETLQYRVDLDLLDYADLLALPIEIPKTDVDFQQLYMPRMLSAESLEDYWQEEFANYDYIFAFNANVIGRSVSLRGQLFATKTFQQVLGLETRADNFNDSIQETFAKVLDFYSKPYREATKEFGVFQLEVKNLPNYQAHASVEQFLLSLKPAFREVKFTKVHGSSAFFDVYYQGDYQEALQLISRSPKIILLEETQFSGEVVTSYK